MEIEKVVREWVVFKVGNLYVEDSLSGITLTDYYSKAKEYNVQSPIFARAYKRIKEIVEKNDLGEFKAIRIVKKLTTNEYEVDESVIRNALKTEELYLEKLREEYTDNSQ